MDYGYGGMEHQTEKALDDSRKPQKKRQRRPCDDLLVGSHASKRQACTVVPSPTHEDVKEVEAPALISAESTEDSDRSHQQEEEEEGGEAEGAVARDRYLAPNPLLTSHETAFLMQLARASTSTGAAGVPTKDDGKGGKPAKVPKERHNRRKGFHEKVMELLRAKEEEGSIKKTSSNAAAAAPTHTPCYDIPAPVPAAVGYSGNPYMVHPTVMGQPWEWHGGYCAPPIYTVMGPSGPVMVSSSGYMPVRLANAPPPSGHYAMHMDPFYCSNNS